MVWAFLAFNKATALALDVPFCTLEPGLVATFLPLAAARALADNLAKMDWGFLPAAAFFLASLVLGLAFEATFLAGAAFLATGFLAAAAAGFLAGAGFLAAAAGAAGLAAASFLPPAAEVVAEAFFSGFLSPGLAAKIRENNYWWIKIIKITYNINQQCLLMVHLNKTYVQTKALFQYYKLE